MWAGKFEKFDSYHLCGLKSLKSLSPKKYKPNQTKPDQTKPDQTKPDQTKPNSPRNRNPILLLCWAVRIKQILPTNAIYDATITRDSIIQPFPLFAYAEGTPSWLGASWRLRRALHA